MSLFDELSPERGMDREGPGLVAGVLLGEVVDNWDEEHPGMVKVQLLLGEEGKDDLGWVPVASPYAGKGFGFYQLPEIGSQVIVAFYLGHSHSPYVIGCLWNKANALPEETAKEKNTTKRLRTKGGNEIVISDEEGKERITVRTKAGHVLDLDDGNQKLSLKDKDGKNAVELDAKNGLVSLMADKKAVLKVGGKEMVTLDGQGKKLSLAADNIEIKAGQKLTLKGQNTSLEGSSTAIKGQNIKGEAQASLALKGTASLKAESSGILEVKGAMVKIN